MNYAIVDIETTGSYAGSNSITEIAIIIHNGKYVLERYQSLINPLSLIPYHIQMLTGIDNEMVAEAPIFKEIAPKIFELLSNCIFVAHNVNFDYSFIVKEFQESGYNWKAPKLCTVRLARKIIPNLASYSLGKLCQNLHITNHARHRAMGDAEATSKLFELLISKDSEGIIDATLNKTKEQRLPTYISEEDFLKLPDTVGVYCFKNKEGQIIYVGKAVNIKKRVFSHFSGNNSTKQRQSFLNEIKYIDYLESGTELMALLMECQFIKKFWPKYNKALKKFEPKFGLMQYEDQNGYIRLMVSPFNKNANVIQFFERATEANQLLLEVIDKFSINPMLCFFYTERQKSKIENSKLPILEDHNTKVYEAIDYIKSKAKSFTILDQGRNLEEKSYIHFKNGHLYAFGFINVYHQFNDIEDLIPTEDKCIGNYYMSSLVLQYAERFPRKVIYKTD